MHTCTDRTPPRPLHSLLQGLELSKEFAFSKGDDVGVQTAKAAIAGVNTFVEVMVICVIAVFSIFLAYAMVGRNEKVRHFVSVLARFCSSPGSTAGEAGTLGHEDENEGKKRRCNCRRRRKRNRRLNRGVDGGGWESGDGGGEEKGDSDVGTEAAVSSVELITVGGASAADVEDTETAAATAAAASSVGGAVEFQVNELHDDNSRAAGAADAEAEASAEATAVGIVSRRQQLSHGAMWLNTMNTATPYTPRGARGEEVAEGGTGGAGGAGGGGEGSIGTMHLNPMNAGAQSSMTAKTDHEEVEIYV